MRMNIEIFLNNLCLVFWLFQNVHLRTLNYVSSFIFTVTVYRGDNMKIRRKRVDYR